MSFNPFEQKTKPIDDIFMDWQTMSARPYNKKTVDPYTKCRLILTTGAEFEAVQFSHRFFRGCTDNDVRRQLTLVRRSEQQQQKRLASFKPVDETTLETTIGYEQLAVDLTAELAKREENEYVQQALDFALLEDFDHLYRYADLLEMDMGVEAERLVGGYTEIMPGRPTIAEHRYPTDDVKRYCNFKKSSVLTTLNVNIITAAEQQTMNYYMNVGSFYGNKLGRDLYAEIAMIEEQHVSLYGSLLDTTTDNYENLLLHEYTECYLYYSMYLDETDKAVKAVYEQCLEQELTHLNMAVIMLNKYAHKEWKQIIPKGEFPELLRLGSNIDYVRKVLANTVNLTAKKEEYSPLSALQADADFFAYQHTVNDKLRAVASHAVIAKYIADNGKDYRYERAEHPIPQLQNRRADNVEVGRVPQ